MSGLHHVAITVSDLDRSVEWYQRVLGLVERFREASPNRRAAILGFQTAADSVGLVEHLGSTGAPFDPTVTGLDHLAMAVPSIEELQEWGAHFDAQGIPHSGVIEIPPGAILNFRDPDNVALALFWDRPE